MGILSENSLVGASGVIPDPREYKIDNALRVDGGWMGRTVGSAPTNADKFTYSVWVKRGNLDSGSTQYWILGATSPGFAGAESNIRFTNDKIHIHLTGSNYDFWTDQVFRDNSSWYHLLFVYDSANSTASDRLKMYVNGVQATWSSSTTIPSGTDNEFTKNLCTTTISGYSVNNHPYEGYLSDIHFVDGQALTPSDFGVFVEDYNDWYPIKYAGTHGTNGFYLDFKNASSLGNDASSNSNNFTLSNIATTDHVIDSPTNNFATLNTYLKRSHPSYPMQAYYEGNLYMEFSPAGGGATTAHATQAIPGGTGKWYQEILIPSFGTVAYGTQYQISTARGHPESPNEISQYMSSFTTSYGDVYGLYFDNGALQLFKNGTSFQTGTINSNQATNDLYMTFWSDQGSGNRDMPTIYNFGQDATFAGQKSPSTTYTDANGYGEFTYQPPTGALALCSANITETVIPSKHFNTVTYAGTSSSNARTDVGFQPDLVWLKVRDYTYSHILQDSVRGAGKEMRSNTTASEVNRANSLTSFDSNGFTVTTDAAYNNSGNNYVAWNWKGGGAAVSNTSGTITSSVSVNQDAGFSIVSYTGTGSAGTVGHGLSQKPDLTITKDRDLSSGWIIEGAAFGSPTYGLRFDSSGRQNDVGNTLAPTASVLDIPSGWGGNNTSLSKYIAYCFHSVPGYSKVGIYKANGSADGTFINCGFSPQMVIIKNYERSQEWIISDFVRDNTNPSQAALNPDMVAVESSGNAIDYLSNGFRIRESGGGINYASGENMIFIAFAELSPKWTNAR